ncbi:hypothetical protein FRUB_07551 [Fimbriiglobus ruber]|uniref:Uncharacterized protein n=1 Tax=Fimbriiglobus ruber TaxID=1908690 RepID=A0A225DA36_9BACT|nr:hypothetical protein FRUB_07551 [Fimbriiglobus ruber]
MFRSGQAITHSPIEPNPPTECNPSLFTPSDFCSDHERAGMPERSREGCDSWPNVTRFVSPLPFLFCDRMSARVLT